MKIQPQHFEHMKATIAALDPAKVAAHKVYLQGLDGVKDLDKRFRWDLMHAAKLPPFLCDTLYKSGLDDAHIDTALRAIVRELNL